MELLTKANKIYYVSGGCQQEAVHNALVTKSTSQTDTRGTGIVFLHCVTQRKSENTILNRIYKLGIS